MSLPNTFATQTGNVPAGELDENFDAVANMGIYRCSATGTNVVTLATKDNQPAVAAYADNMGFFWVAQNTSTGNVQIQVGTLGDVQLYNQDGTIAGANSQEAGAAYVGFYESTLNGGSGGIQLAQTPPTTATSIVAFNSISGFIPSTFTGSTNANQALSVSVGQASDSTNAVYISKNTATAWAVANGNAVNGYQGGNTLPATAETIHFFAIQDASGANQGVFASLSESAPTLPSTHTGGKFRRIFSLVTTSAGLLIAGTATEINGGGIRFYYSAGSITDVNNVTMTTGSRTLTVLASIPTGIKMMARFRFEQNGTGASLITSPDELDQAATGGTTNPGQDAGSGTGATQSVTLDCLTNSSAQIGIRGSTANGAFVWTRGYDDFRRS
jgi:hypothetical protein